jgi:hypothetical protein
VAFERLQLLTWMASMWTWIEDDPDVGRWAAEFVAARAG